MRMWGERMYVQSIIVIIRKEKSRVLEILTLTLWHTVIVFWIAYGERHQIIQRLGLFKVLIQPALDSQLMAPRYQLQPGHSKAHTSNCYPASCYVIIILWLLSDSYQQLLVIIIFSGKQCHSRQVYSVLKTHNLELKIQRHRYTARVTGFLTVAFKWPLKSLRQTRGFCIGSGKWLTLI